MNNKNRDLLVLLKQDLLTASSLEMQVDFLHDLLYHVEKSAWVVQAHEIININRSRIIQKKDKVKKALLAPSLKPFVFINNKN